MKEMNYPEEVIEIKRILYKFLKLNGIFYNFQRIIYEKKINLDNNINRLIRSYNGKPPLDYFFQNTNYFCVWNYTTEGSDFWLKYSLFWRISLMCHSKYPSNIDKLKNDLQEHINGKCIMKKEILDYMDSGIVQVINHEILISPIKAKLYE